MRRADELAIVSMPTWAILVVWAVGYVTETALLGLVLTPIWMVLLVSDLHRAVPAGFYESEDEAVLSVAAAYGLLLLVMVVDGAQALVGWAGVPASWIAPLVPTSLLTFVSMVLWVRAVRHVMSAVASVEAGRPERVSWGLTLLNAVLLPLFVLWAHHNARKLLLADGPDPAVA